MLRFTPFIGSWVVFLTKDQIWIVHAIMNGLVLVIRITTSYHCMLLLPSLWHHTTIFLVYTTSITSTSTAASSTTTTTFSTTSYTCDASLLYTCCFQNPCESSPCKNGVICQSGYTVKGYRCVGVWGIICKDSTKKSSLVHFSEISNELKSAMQIGETAMKSNQTKFSISDVHKEGGWVWTV